MKTETLRQYICTTLLNNAGTTIADDEDLLMSGILDSISVMKLASHLESECNIAIPAEDIVLENFSTLAQIQQYLEQRMKG